MQRLVEVNNNSETKYYTWMCASISNTLHENRSFAGKCQCDKIFLLLNCLGHWTIDWQNKTLSEIEGHLSEFQQKKTENIDVYQTWQRRQGLLMLC